MSSFTVVFFMITFSSGWVCIQGARRRSGTTSLHPHLLKIPASEPHHVCITGNRAQQVMASFVQRQNESLTQFKMDSVIAPTNECMAHEYAVGHTLFTVGNVDDRCIARWKVHSSSCDVLVHAHSGTDCTDLWKFRMVTDQCHAPLVVAHSDQRLLSCYQSKAEKVIRTSTNKLSKDCMDVDHEVLLQDHDSGRDIVAAMRQALSSTAKFAEERFSQDRRDRSDAHGDSTMLRQHLHEATVDTSDLQLAFLKHTQKVPSSPRAASMLQQMLTGVRKKQNRTKGKDDEIKTVVIDNGTGNIKAGFTDEEDPRVTFPTAVGIPKHEGIMVGLSGKTQWIGSAVKELFGVLKLRYAIVHGVVKDWNMMEDIWHHAFEELEVDPQETEVLLTEAPMNPTENKKKLQEIMFSKFGVKRTFVMLQAVLALYASARTTGVVVDSGDGVTHIVPVYEGYAIDHQVKRMDIAGRDLTDYMQRILYEIGVQLPNSAEKDVVRQMKERLAFVALDFEKEMGLAQENKDADGNPLEQDFELPDGEIVRIGDIRFRVPEVLFDPNMLGQDRVGGGLHAELFDAISECGMDIHKDLYHNIILSGGTSMLKNLDRRLELELKKKVPLAMKSNVKVQLCRSPEECAERKLAVWRGGAIMAGMSDPTVEELWIDNPYSE